VNDLDLPPRRSLPVERKARIRAKVMEDSTSVTRRWVAPVSIAAGFAVVVMGAALMMTPSGETIPPAGEVQVSATRLPQALRNTDVSAEDLDRCAAAAAASPRANHFAARKDWVPTYAVEIDGHRITAYKEHGARPMFCDVTGKSVAVSDPSEEPMSLGRVMQVGESWAHDYYALYMSPSWVLTGVAQRVSKMDFEVTGTSGSRIVSAIVEQEQFVVHLGQLADGDKITTIAYDADGKTRGTSMITFDSKKLRAPGAAGNDRP
jgi:hypothetical protein